MTPSQRRTIPVSDPAHPAHPAHPDGAPARPAGAPPAGTWAGRQAAAAHEDGPPAAPDATTTQTPGAANAGTSEDGRHGERPVAPHEQVPAESHTQPQHQAEQPAPPQPLDASAGAAGNGPEELARVTAERDEYLALAQRARADFENYRKRMARDSRLAEERGVVKVVREFLPALDNLQRALDSAATDDPLLAGVRLVRSDIQSALSRLGVESFSPLGEEFDPSAQEAVAVQPVPGALTGSVVEVYQSGYRAGETIIRPARVVVAGE